jgi:hypothetical protein
MKYLLLLALISLVGCSENLQIPCGEGKFKYDVRVTIIGGYYQGQYFYTNRRVCVDGVWMYYTDRFEVGAFFESNLELAK